MPGPRAESEGGGGRIDPWARGGCCPGRGRRRPARPQVESDNPATCVCPLPADLYYLMFNQYLPRCGGSQDSSIIRSMLFIRL